MRGARRLWMLIAALLLVAAPGLAQAQSCSYAIDSVNFGTIDVTANTAHDAPGTFRLNCSTLVQVQFRVCPNIGAGTGGGNASGNPRYLLNGSNQLAYNIFSDSGRTTVWGSRLWAGAPPPIDFLLVLLGVNTTRPMYLTIPAGQQAVPPGVYTSSFTGHTTIDHQSYLLVPPSCAGMGSPGATAPFTVTATVPPICTVSASLLDFGSIGLLQSNVDSANTISVTCSATVPYTVSLDGGLSGATNPTQRKMTRVSEQVTYGLYRDTGRTQPWGSTVGTNTVAGTGTGFAQPYSAFGRVAPQATPSPGTYTDSIVVTVTY